MKKESSVSNPAADSERSGKLKAFGIRDVVVLSLLVAGCFCVFIAFGRPEETGRFVVVSVSGVEIERVPLDLSPVTNIDITGDGSDKPTNFLRIEDGKAYMTGADCPDGLCIRQGAISHVNESLVCLPNKVVVYIDGAEAGDAQIDAVSGR